MTSTTPQAQAPAESSSQDMSQIPSQASESEPDMPEQRHAGKVGYGPNYHVGATLADKVIGLKEELIGKITKDPGRVQHGREVLTGEEKRKKLVGADEPNPFNVDKDDKSDNESQKREEEGKKLNGADEPNAVNVDKDDKSDNESQKWEGERKTLDGAPEDGPNSFNVDKDDKSDNANSEST